MFKETFKYTDYNGVEREETHYFDLSQPDIMRLNYGSGATLKEIVEKITQEQDGGRIIELFEKIILASYGEKSEDGKLFIKDEAARRKFQYSPMYPQMYMRLATDAEYAARFVREITPKTEEGGNFSIVKH